MLLHEDVKDWQSIAKKYFRFGGMPLISSSRSQKFKLSLVKKWNSLMHSGMTVKLFPVRSKFFILANHGRSVGKKSSVKLQHLS